MIKRLLRGFALLVTAALVAIAGFQPAVAQPTKPSGPAHRPGVAGSKPVTGLPVRTQVDQTDQMAKKMKMWEPARSTWDEGSASVDLSDPAARVGDGLIQAGKLTAWVGRSTAPTVKRHHLNSSSKVVIDKVRVRQIGDEAPRALGLVGHLFSVSIDPPAKQSPHRRHRPDPESPPPRQRARSHYASATTR